ncbi:MAG: phosphatase PAP2 family protein [Pirellulales bacterium]|nr:phosphatase PAP2 family protein [Pirellulales bacterium]
MIGLRGRCVWMFGCVLLLTLTNACSQRWTFAPPRQLGHSRGPTEIEDVDTAGASSASGGEEKELASLPQRARSDRDRPASWDDSGEILATGALMVGRDTPRHDDMQSGLIGRITWQAGDTVEIESLPPVAEMAPGALTEAYLGRISDEGDGRWVPELAVRGYRVARCVEVDLVDRTGYACPRLPETLGRFRWKALRDHRNYYLWPGTADLLLGIGGASILANTSLDHDFSEWVREEVRCEDADEFADFWKAFGEGHVAAPAVVGLAVTGWLLEDYPFFDAMGRYGARSGRAYLVGFPSVLFLQFALGGSRPGEFDHESSWRPFEDDNAASGHAFIGAVPFITAAQMIENRYAKACFYFMSTLPAWSRVEDDAHYLSQVGLGWWIAYLACRSVDQTEATFRRRAFAITPMCRPGTAGFMAAYEF